MLSVWQRSSITYFRRLPSNHKILRYETLVLRPVLDAAKSEPLNRPRCDDEAAVGPFLPRWLHAAN